MLLNKKALELYRIASKDDTRYAICGVRILPDGAAVSTNGHALIHYSPGGDPAAMESEYPAMDEVCVYDGTENRRELVPFTLPRDACRDVLKMLPKKSQYRVISNYVALDVERTNSNGHAVLGVNGLDGQEVNKPNKLDGDYPDFEKVMPTDPPVSCVGLGIELLQSVLETFKACGVKSVKFAVNDQHKPVRIKGVTDDGDVLLAVVMPVRME